MKDVILNLIQSNPLRALKIIKTNLELMKWVENNCDKNCLDIPSKIYTSIHPNEKILCPCGSGKLRKFISFSNGLSFCGKANACSATKESVRKNVLNLLNNGIKKKPKKKELKLI